MRFNWSITVVAWVMVQGIIGEIIVVTKTVYVENSRTVAGPELSSLVTSEAVSVKGSSSYSSSFSVSSSKGASSTTVRAIPEGQLVLGINPSSDPFEECMEWTDSDSEDDTPANATDPQPIWGGNITGDDHDKTSNNSFYKNYNNTSYNNSNHLAKIGRDPNRSHNLTQSRLDEQILSSLPYVPRPEMSTIESNIAGATSPMGTMVSKTSKNVDESVWVTDGGSTRITRGREVGARVSTRGSEIGTRGSETSTRGSEISTRGSETSAEAGAASTTASTITSTSTTDSSTTIKTSTQPLTKHTTKFGTTTANSTTITKPTKAVSTDPPTFEFSKPFNLVVHSHSLNTAVGLFINPIIIFMLLALI